MEKVWTKNQTSIFQQEMVPVRDGKNPMQRTRIQINFQFHPDVSLEERSLLMNTIFSAASELDIGNYNFTSKGV